MAKVLFAQEIYFPFQSIERLSAYLKHSDNEVDLIIGDEQKITEYIQKTNPDLIAFSVLTPYRNHTLACATSIKEAGIKTPIIAGGYDITFLPDILEYSDVDIICRGEGEQALKELCNRLDSGKDKDYTDIPNLWVKKNGKIYQNQMRPWLKDYDVLPFDDRDLYLNYDSYFSIIPFTQVLVGRGCPYLCSYCFNHGFRELYRSEGSTGYCILRSVDNVIEELRLLKENYTTRYIFFNDSTLTYKKDWIIEFCRKHKEHIKIPFSINAVIQEIDEDIAKALADNGYCELIRFGLETGNEKFRKTVLNKKISNEQFFKGTDLLKKYNLRYSMAMMLGLPGETLDLSWETIEMARKLSAPNSVHAVNIFKPFPGLDITDYGIKIGQYREEDISAHQVPENLKMTAGDGEKVRDIKKKALGTRDMCFYENYRVDEEGQMILRLSRFSHLAIRFPFLRPLIRQLIKLPDNFIYRFIWMATEGLLNIKAHANVPMTFFFKLFLFHRGKKIR
ncbi:MAG: radical SAM protein [Candidatus Omnitrophica bacterium]|nr:radical SAM protein [Candidatus Omnitrophota bacterium]